MNKKVKTVSDLLPGEIGRICRVSHNQEAMSLRLLELGFIPGALITCIRWAPLGDPREFSVNGARFCIRKEDAKALELEVA